MALASWKRAKGWPGWALLAIVVAALLTVGIGSDNTPPTAQERVEAVSKRLACPICDGESVFESRNTASANIRDEIRQQVDAGVLSNDEIISYFVQRNSRLLLVPKATGLDALVWALPAFAAVCAIAGLAFAFHRWKLVTDTVPTDADRALVDEARTEHDQGAPDADEP
jgi:cytochrome c-type biogenesis protein CcmH